MQTLRARGQGAVIAAAVVVAAVFALAAPASAHTVAVSGTTSCPDGEHVVSWTLHNQETLPDRPMTVVAATATVGGQTFAVTGFDTTVAPGGNTQGTTIVPGDVNGTIEITVRVAWPDNYRGRATNTVLLQPPCEHSTTTTSSSTSSTTTPESTTTSTPATSSTSSPPVTGGTAPTTAPTLPPSSGVQGIEGGSTTTISGAAAGTLPRTGEDSQPWAFAGVGAFVLGLALLAVSKPRWARR
jgi:LPXTG-motif cell wall-anchored protein